MDPETLDLPAVVKGASRGFAVLFLGGLVQPLASMTFAPLAYVWLLLVALVAFGLAAVMATPVETPTIRWKQAPVAALASYALILPLVMIGSGSINPLQLVLTAITAVVVGATVGLARTHYAASLVA